MIARLRFSWRMVGHSVTILRRQPHFMLFPILSAIALMVILSLLGWLVLWAWDYDLAALAAVSGWMKLAGVFVLYLICYAVALFANTGLVGAILQHMDEGAPTIEDSFRIAASRADKLLLYAALMATIGTFFRWIGQYIGLAGRMTSPIWRRLLVFFAVGVAWNLITYLSIPILAAENVGPFQALRRSAVLIKRTWGDQVVAYISTGLLFWLFLIPWTLASGALIERALRSMNEALLIASVYGAVMVPLTLFLIKLTIDSIFCVVIYRYVKGEPLGRFDEELVSHAFQAKPSSVVGRVRHLGPL